MFEVKESNKIIFSQNATKINGVNIRINHKIDFSAWNQLLLLLIIMCFFGYWNCGVDVINYPSHQKSSILISFDLTWQTTRVYPFFYSMKQQSVLIFPWTGCLVHCRLSQKIRLENGNNFKLLDFQTKSADLWQFLLRLSDSSPFLHHLSPIYC